MAPVGQTNVQSPQPTQSDLSIIGVRFSHPMA